MNKRLLGVWFLIALVGCTPENGDGPMAVPDSALPVSGCPLDAPVDACGICGGEGPVTWYADVDGDGLGDARSPIRACEAPAAFVREPGDPEPDCATNDTDLCGVCGGEGPLVYFADVDGDGVGDGDVSVLACTPPPGFVRSQGDPEPQCATDDTDVCGICGGPGAMRYFADVDGDGAGDAAVSLEACSPPDGFVLDDSDPEPLCATDDTDECGVCAGANESLDCLGVCGGMAALDGCGRCVGGTSGLNAAAADTDQDGLPDLCDQCPEAPRERAVLQWTEMGPRDGSGGPYTFQVILEANGDFTFQYLDVEPFQASMTVGHQGPGGQHALTFDYNGEVIREQAVAHFVRGEDGRPRYEAATPFVWIEGRFGGERLDFAGREVTEVDLGFPFPFGDAEYETVQVSANGLLVFAGEVPDGQNAPLPLPDRGPLLAPFWDAFDPTSRGGRVTLHRLPAECAQDCAGIFGGTAFVDDCGQCVGGVTGAVPDGRRDCSGACDGGARIDVCGQCAGGATGLEPSVPEDCVRAPDLVVDEPYLRQTATLDTLEVEDQCLVEENCVHGLGLRRLLRFGTRIGNIGNADLRLGRPNENDPRWHFDECHGHYHLNAYAAYELHDAVTGERLPIGAKNGFSVIDIGVYDSDLAPDGCRGYNGENQGITVGCQDTYGRNLQCQWIDITDVPDGLYDLVVVTNPDNELVELNYENNTARVRIQLSDGDLRIIRWEAHCDDGLDDDGDGAVDCDDPDCEEICALPPRDPPTPCPDEDLGRRTGPEAFRAPERPAADRLNAFCAGQGRGEVALTWTAPREDHYQFNTIGSTFDTALYLLEGGCEGAELGCNERHPQIADGNAAAVEVALAADQEVTIVVDGMLVEDGEYILNIHGRSEACRDEVDLGATLGLAVVQGNTNGASTPFLNSCAASASLAVFTWTAPGTGEYVFDTRESTYDTALSAFAGRCGLEELACNDDTHGLQSEVRLPLTAGETVTLAVGGYHGRTGDFVLNIAGPEAEPDPPADDAASPEGESE